MISAIVFIAFIDEPELRGLSVGMVPTAENPSDWEKVAWTFLELAWKQASTRLQEQMVKNSRTSIETIIEGDARTEFEERMRAKGLLNRIAGTFMVVGPPLMYFAITNPAERHPLEESAWKTVKRAMDIVSDWMRSDAGFSGATYQADYDMMAGTLEAELDKLPVFAKLKTKRGKKARK